jgi:hypothetical protein
MYRLYVLIASARLSYRYRFFVLMHPLVCSAHLLSLFVLQRMCSNWLVRVFYAAARIGLTFDCAPEESLTGNGAGWLVAVSMASCSA